MANVTAKTSSNIFYKARCEAATHNEQLSSREGAADYMSIDRGRLYRIESGIAVPYPEEIRLMADLYNARIGKLFLQNDVSARMRNAKSGTGEFGQDHSQNAFGFPEDRENKRNASRHHRRWCD